MATEQAETACVDEGLSRERFVAVLRARVCCHARFNLVNREAAAVSLLCAAKRRENYQGLGVLAQALTQLALQIVGTQKTLMKPSIKPCNTRGLLGTGSQGRSCHRRRNGPSCKRVSNMEFSSGLHLVVDGPGRVRVFFWG